MQGPGTARADQAGGIDDALDPRQMGGQGSPVAPPLGDPRRPAGRLAVGGSQGGGLALLGLLQPSSSWSSGRLSARRPKRWRCIAWMIWRSRSFSARSSAKSALSVSGSSGGGEAGAATNEIRA